MSQGGESSRLVARSWGEVRDDTAVLLTYYYHQEDARDHVLRHIIEANCPAYLPWDRYLREPLERLFPNVIVYDYLKQRARLGLEAMNREIVELVRACRPRYLVWTSFHYDVMPGTLDEVRRLGTTVLGWFFDDEWRFENYSKYWIPHLDYCVTNSVTAVAAYRALGARVVATVPNTGIAVERDWQAVRYVHDVSFVGNVAFADRRECIDLIEKAGVEVAVFGPDNGGYVSFEDMLNVFYASRINLNFSKAGGYQDFRQLKGRMFQACMAGGFVLTEYAPGLEEYFTAGKDLGCFNSPEELVKLVRYYLDQEEKRRSMARAGWEKATRRYSSDAMTASVFEIVQTDIISGRKPDISPVLTTMPWRTRLVYPSYYHFHWGKALLLEGAAKDRWNHAFRLALGWNRANLPAWFFLLAGNLPGFVSRPLIRRYNWMSRLPGQVARRFRAVPFFEKLVQSLVRKLI